MNNKEELNLKKRLRKLKYNLKNEKHGGKQRRLNNRIKTLEKKLPNNKNKLHKKVTIANPFYEILNHG